MKFRISRRSALQGLASTAAIAGMPAIVSPSLSAPGPREEIQLRTWYLIEEWQRVTVTIEEKGSAYVIPHLAGLHRSAANHALFPQRSGYLVFSRILYSGKVEKKIHEAPYVRFDELHQAADHVALYHHNKFAEPFGSEVPIGDCVKGCQINTRHTEELRKPYPFERWELAAKFAFAEKDFADSDNGIFAAAHATVRDEVDWVQRYRRQDPELSALWEFLYQALKSEPSRISTEPHGHWVPLDV